MSQNIRMEGPAPEVTQETFEIEGPGLYWVPGPGESPGVVCVFVWGGEGGSQGPWEHLYQKTRKSAVKMPLTVHIWTIDDC